MKQNNYTNDHFNIMHSQGLSISHNNKIKGPPLIKPEKIKKITDKLYLMKLERHYDDFLERSHHILLLHDCLEEYLDIRDAISVRLSKLIREDEKRLYYLTHTIITNMNNIFYSEYNEKFQSLLMPDLQLTSEQIDKGYIQCPNEPRAYKCGCLSMKYYIEQQTQCECNECLENGNTEIELDTLPILKKYHYCDYHSKLMNKKKILEGELINIRKELSKIKSHKNSFDFQYYIHIFNINNEIKPQYMNMSKYP